MMKRILGAKLSGKEAMKEVFSDHNIQKVGAAKSFSNKVVRKRGDERISTTTWL